MFTPGRPITVSCEAMRRTRIVIFVPLLLLAAVLLANILPGRAQAGDPYSLVDAVNGLRAANGRPAYEMNSILMSIAQGHSDYMASIGTVTHEGAGGTRPRDRAAAAGYGGGATFFISENIAGGTDLSVDGAISMWLQDDPHIQTMLGASYREIGAGVAEANGFVYYTIDVAYVAGGNYSPLPTTAPGGPTPMPIYAVQTSTPSPDGGIIHKVLYGQNLTTIARAYGLTVAEIKDRNYLTSDIIYAGQKLLIRPSNTPGPSDTPTGTVTSTHAATATLKPTRTPTPSASPTPTAVQTLVASASLQGSSTGGDSLGSILVVAIIILAVGGVVLMVAGSLIRRRTQA